MQPTTAAAPPYDPPPDHTQLPDKDGSIVENFQEHPQSNLLTDSLLPRLRELHPDGQFCIGCDSGIYWKWTKEPLEGCKAPDWFYVPGVPPMLDGQYRRSYVLWQEGVRPHIVAEYVSNDKGQEHDRTPQRGKFWVYEQAIAAPYYVIFDSRQPTLEVYRLESGRYQPLAATATGRFPIEPLRVELGIWQGEYRGMDLPWLRAWDSDSGELLPTSEELAAREQRRADGEHERADTAEELLDDARRQLQEETERAEGERKRAEEQQRLLEEQRQKADRLAARLRELGIDPEA